MVGLVPIEKDVIPVVLLVNMHLIKGIRLFSHVAWLGTGQFRWSIGTNRKGCHSSGSVGEYTSH